MAEQQARCFARCSAISSIVVLAKYVEVGGEVIHAISPTTEQYKIGEKVSLKMRQAEKQTKAHTG